MEADKRAMGLAYLHRRERGSLPKELHPSECE